MKLFLQKYISVLAFLIIPCSVFAQKDSIAIKVVTLNCFPVKNASVEVKHLENVLKTDRNGLIKLQNKEIQKIKVSANGFFTQKVNVTDKMNLCVIDLEVKPNRKSQESAVNSGHIENGEEFYKRIKYLKENPDYSRYRSVSQIIQDKYPGLRVGGGGVIIRGATGLALIDVDGVQCEYGMLNTLNTSNIKNIEVLTPAKSGNYGARGGNGVIKITTKR